MKNDEKNSVAGNRTPVIRVTGGDTSHYTTTDHTEIFNKTLLFLTTSLSSTLFFANKTINNKSIAHIWMFLVILKDRLHDSMNLIFQVFLLELIQFFPVRQRTLVLLLVHLFHQQHSLTSYYINQCVQGDRCKMQLLIVIQCLISSQSTRSSPPIPFLLIHLAILARQLNLFLYTISHFFSFSIPSGSSLMLAGIAVLGVQEVDWNLFVPSSTHLHTSLHPHISCCNDDHCRQDSLYRTNGDESDAFDLSQEQPARVCETLFHLQSHSFSVDTSKYMISRPFPPPKSSYTTLLITSIHTLFVRHDTNRNIHFYAHRIDPFHRLDLSLMFYWTYLVLFKSTITNTQIHLVSFTGLQQFGVLGSLGLRLG